MKQDAEGDLAHGRRFVVEHDQLICPHRNQRVGVSIIVAELHLNDARLRLFDDSAHLTSAEAIFGCII